MRAILSVFLFAVTVSSQSPYFLDVKRNSYSMQSVTDQDIHYSVNVNFDTLPAGSTMVCENTCTWEYNTVFVSDSSYHITICRDYVVHLGFTYSFFDTDNREFQFTMTGPVDSIWGDTLATPGYDKTIYARLKSSVCNEATIGNSEDSFSIYKSILEISKKIFSVGGLIITGTLPGSPSVTFSKATGTISLNSCPESSPYPQGKWTWLYTAKSTSSGAIALYDTTFPSLQNSITMTIKDDSIYLQNGNDTIRSDTINSLSRCSGKLTAFDTTYSFTYMGPTILCLETRTSTPNTMHPNSTTATAYYISSEASIDTLVTRTVLPAPAGRNLSPLSLDHTTNQSIHIAYSLRKISGIRLTLYSLSGRNISTLSETWKPAGTYSESIRLPSHLPNGCYLAVLSINGISTAAKINLIR
ncbi:MAG: hypothetical protein JW863_02535 [Chitinispirillaceae bacterium]|nr:hypothetical protein [Chitinispirillaceae bacterium]